MLFRTTPHAMSSTSSQQIFVPGRVCLFGVRAHLLPPFPSNATPSSTNHQPTPPLSSNGSFVRYRPRCTPSCLPVEVQPSRVRLQARACVDEAPRSRCGSREQRRGWTERAEGGHKTLNVKLRTTRCADHTTLVVRVRGSGEPPPPPRPLRLHCTYASWAT